MNNHRHQHLVGKQNNWPKLLQMGFSLGFPHFLKVVRPWHRFAREAVVASSLEMSKARLDWTWSNLI